MDLVWKALCNKVLMINLNNVIKKVESACQLAQLCGILIV